MPVFFIQLITPQNGSLTGTSLKGVAVHFAARFFTTMRCRNAAMAPRVTGRSGPKVPLS